MAIRAAAMAVALAIAAGTAAVQTAGAGARNEMFRAQTDVLDERAAQQYANSVRLKPRSVVTPSKAGLPRWRGSYRGAYLLQARAAARQYRVPEGLFLRLVQRESGWNPRARSHKGAIGLAQLMPRTARRLGIDPTNPRQNLKGGARYLRDQYEAFNSWRLALAAYNAGPRAVRRHGGIPPYRETRRYVRAILGE